MKSHHIYIIDGILIVGTLALFLFAFIYLRPTLSSPEDGFTTTGAVLFSFENGDQLLIDDNPGFSSPDRIPVVEEALITLEPGTYYWKVEGALSSEIRHITVNSVVELQVRKSERGYDITNGGTTRLAVDVYDQGVLTGKIILDPEEHDDASGDQFVGREAASA